ncbi:15713_t:CDS:2, partial [Acaulospora morrowiae]
DNLFEQYRSSVFWTGKVKEILRHTPISNEFDNSMYLSVPASEKNMLISPPGSPSANWIQIREDSPNSVTLADDLVHALAHISLHNFDSDSSDLEEFSLDDKLESALGDDFAISQMQIPILTVLPKDVESNLHGDVDVPLILIQDWDETPASNKNFKKPLQVNSISRPYFCPTPAPASFLLQS